MHFPTPETDLRGFRLSRINEPQFRHLWWLLFWPVYLLRYFLVEHWNPAQTYHVMHCFLDDWIPFQEGFIVFYASWYFLIVGGAPVIPSCTTGILSAGTANSCASACPSPQ